LVAWGRAASVLEAVARVVIELLLHDETVVVAVDNHIDRAQAPLAEVKVEDDPGVGAVFGYDSPFVQRIVDGSDAGDGELDEFQCPFPTDDATGPTEKTGGRTQVDDVGMIER
jgi:hypothetical protein